METTEKMPECSHRYSRARQCEENTRRPNDESHRKQCQLCGQQGSDFHLSAD